MGIYSGLDCPGCSFSRDVEFVIYLEDGLGGWRQAAGHGVPLLYMEARIENGPFYFRKFSGKDVSR